MVIPTTALLLGLILEVHLADFKAHVWGFYPHQMINRMAVFTLPPAMLTFYKYNLHAVSALAVQADRRRYAMEGEAPRHYIDLDYYGQAVPRDWREAQLCYPPDSLKAHGILPWHFYNVRYQLIQAFKSMDAKAVIRISADAGHYLADAHVPLHTTSNYNGQQTNQTGIHGFWETRVPELLWEEFDLWTGKAEYHQDYHLRIWDIVWKSHDGVERALNSEKVLTEAFAKDQKYGYEQRNSRTVRVYSQKFTRQYHKALDRQVEKRLRRSIKEVGDFWYSCWVDAGQPSLLGQQVELEDSLLQMLDQTWRWPHRSRE